MQLRVDLDRHHGSYVRGHHAGERAGAGAHLQNHVIGRELCRVDEQSRQVEIDKKILPALCVGVDAHLGKASDEK